MGWSSQEGQEASGGVRGAGEGQESRPAAAGAGAERAYAAAAGGAAAARAREDEVASINEKRPIHLRAVTAGIAKVSEKGHREGTPPSPSPLVAPPYVPLIVPQLRSRSSIVHGINTQIDNGNLRFLQQPGVVKKRVGIALGRCLNSWM